MVHIGCSQLKVCHVVHHWIGWVALTIDTERWNEMRCAVVVVVAAAVVHLANAIALRNQVGLNLGSNLAYDSNAQPYMIPYMIPNTCMAVCSVSGDPHVYAFDGDSYGEFLVVVERRVGFISLWLTFASHPQRAQ